MMQSFCAFYIKFQKPFHCLLTSLFEKWYDSGEKVGAINLLEGIVLRQKATLPNTQEELLFYI